MVWKRGNPGCPCCGNRTPCPEYYAKCVSSPYTDSDGRSMDTSLFEWLIVATISQSEAVDFFVRRNFSDHHLVTVNASEGGSPRTVILATDSDFANQWKSHTNGMRYCNSEEIRNAEVVVFDREMVGYPFYSVLGKVDGSPISVEMVRYLYLHGEDTWFNTVQSIQGMLNVTEDQCEGFCVDASDEFYFSPEQYQAAHGVPLDVDMQQLTEASVGGIWRSCGTDRQRRVIVAKRVASAQLEIESSLGDVSFSHSREVLCSLGSEAKYVLSTSWSMTFDGTFTGTYPGVFTGGPSLPDGTSPDTAPYSCEKRPHTVFWGDPVPVSLTRTQTVSRRRDEDCNYLECPETAEVSIPYVGFARLVGHFARDTCMTDAVNATTRPRIEVTLYRNMDNTTDSDIPLCPTMQETIDNLISRRAPTHIELTIATWTGAHGGCLNSSDQPNYGIELIDSYTGNGHPRGTFWFPGVDLLEWNVQVSRSPTGGASTNYGWAPSTWSSPPSSSDVDGWALFDPSYKFGALTSTPGVEEFDYRTYYCPPNPDVPACPDTPRPISRTDVSVDLSCAHETGSSLITTVSYECNALVQATRSAIIEGGGTL